MLNDACWNILRRNIVFVKIENNTDSDIYFYWDKTGNGTLSEDRMDPEYIPKQKQWFISTLKLKDIKLFFRGGILSEEERYFGRKSVLARFL